MNEKLTKAFDALEIPITATLEEAKQSWRDLAHVWHPDKHQSNERLQLKATEKLKEINGAWDEVKAYLASPNREHEERERYQRNYASTGRQESEQKAPRSGKYKTLTCPHCGAANQVLRTALFELAMCDSCGKHLSKTEEDKEQARRAEFNKQKERRAEQKRQEEQSEREQRRKDQRQREEQSRNEGQTRSEQKQNDNAERQYQETYEFDQNISANDNAYSSWKILGGLATLLFIVAKVGVAIWKALN